MTPEWKRVVVASENPVKLRAVAGSLERLFGLPVPELLGRSTRSGVPEQPVNSEQTLLGARNRAFEARRLEPHADLWVGIEGGVEEDDVGLAAFAWVVAESRAVTGTGRTASFYLPPAIARLVSDGMELGEADDRVFGRVDSKRDEGAIGILSGGALDRAALYEHAVLAALLPHRNPSLYAS